MVALRPIPLGTCTALGIEVDLPKTHLAILTAGAGYIMCGALDVALLNERLGERRIVAGRAVGVKTLEQLLDAPLESVTEEALRLGITPGTVGRTALEIMARAQA